MKTLSPAELERLPNCKLDWTFGHKCDWKENFGSEPQYPQDCIRCMIDGMFDHLCSGPTSMPSAMHILDVLEKTLVTEKIITERKK